MLDGPERLAALRAIEAEAIGHERESTREQRTWRNYQRRVRSPLEVARRAVLDPPSR